MSGSGPTPDHPPGGAEPHHIPHGYVHPKEKHHWYWYGGFVAAGLVVALVSWIFWQYDHGAGPLCRSYTESTKTSPSGGFELQVARVSCLAARDRQLIVLNKTEQGGSYTVGSFDGEAELRFYWLSEDEAVVRRKGGRMWAFQPHKGGVHFRYR